MTRLKWLILIACISYILAEGASDAKNSIHYPTEAFSFEGIKNGGFVLYFIGLLYMFLGIMQVHRLYLGPSMECFSKAHTFEEDTMISTVRPFALTAPEFFMCLYSTVFGVTDVGISSFLGTNAFTACIERGVFILLAGAVGEIDYFIAYREMITYAVTLLAISVCILDNTIVLWNTIVMIVIYFFYWLFMQFNQVIERKVKLAIGNAKEEDPRLEEYEITELHRLKRRRIMNTPDEVVDEHYNLLSGYVICKGINGESKTLVKQIEGTNPKLVKLYNATNKILCSNANKKLRSLLLRQQTSLNSSKLLKVSSADTKVSELINKENVKIEDSNIKIYPADSVRKRLPDTSSPSEKINDSKDNDYNPVDLADIKHFKILKAVASDNEYIEEEKNMQWNSLVWPKNETLFWKIFYVVMLPISAALYITIPNPRVPRNDEICKLIVTYGICFLWMGFFSFFITWWLVSLSIAFDTPFQLLPMIIQPLGLLLRDFPHWLEFKTRVDLLKKRIDGEMELREKVNLMEAIGRNDHYTEELKNILSDLEAKPHKEVIIEHYSGPTFSLTVGSSITWLIFTLLKGDIILYSHGIWIQLLLLMSLIIIKLVFIVKAKFKTPISLFYEHVIIYCCYFVCVLLIEYLA